MSKKSANLQLLKYLNTIISNVSNGFQVDSVYLDFAKAFDTVVHSKLLSKLRFYGVKGNLLKWIESFLLGRQQSVRVGDFLSKRLDVLSGVPQGSVLGPLLFIIFILDMPYCCIDLHALMFLFADDAKCLSIIRSHADCVSFQCKINAIQKWAFDWQLSLSYEKCNVISFYGTNPVLKFTYTICDKLLNEVDFVTDLAIILASNLSFSRQTGNMCQQARIRSETILRCFQSRDKNLLFKAFPVFVRPLLEYCCNVWSPYKLSEIRQIESVQRKFTKRLFGLKDLPYNVRLSILNSETLELRRIKSDLGMYFKIVHGLVDIPMDCFFTFRIGKTRTNGKTLLKHAFNNNMERYAFKNRCINLWNMLPANVVNSSSFIAFKNTLRLIDLPDLLRQSTISLN